MITAFLILSSIFYSHICNSFLEFVPHFYHLFTNNGGQILQPCYLSPQWDALCLPVFFHFGFNLIFTSDLRLKVNVRGVGEDLMKAAYCWFWTLNWTFWCFSEVFVWPNQSFYCTIPSHLLGADRWYQDVEPSVYDSSRAAFSCLRITNTARVNTSKVTSACRRAVLAWGRLWGGFTQFLYIPSENISTLTCSHPEWCLPSSAWDGELTVSQDSA